MIKKFKLFLFTFQKKRSDLPKRETYDDWKNAANSNVEFVQTDRSYSFIVLALEPNSILVFDNASYHSKKDENNSPSSTWRKDCLKNWLTLKKVPFNPKALKPQLWQLAREKASLDPRYRVDNLIRNAGHKVLRLPPYHFNLNPIALFKSRALFAVFSLFVYIINVSRQLAIFGYNLR